MLRKLKIILNTIWLVIRGYEPIYFMGPGHYLTVHGRNWYVTGEGPYESARAAVAATPKRPDEKWKTVEIQSTVFYVSNLGNVQDQHGKPIHPTFDGKRYHVNLNLNDGQRSTMYRAALVAKAFHGYKRKRGKEIHHVNGNRLDDRACNLRLMSGEEHARLHAAESAKGKAEAKEEAAKQQGGTKKTAQKKTQGSGQTPPKKKPSFGGMPEEFLAEGGSAYRVPMPADSEFRRIVVGALGTCEQRRKKAVKNKALSKAQSWCVYVASTSDPVEAFDEALFAVRACNYFATEHPDLAGDPVKSFLGIAYKMLKDAARGVVARRTEADALALAEARTIIAEERNRDIYLQLNYQKKIASVYGILGGKVGEAEEVA